MANTRAQNTAFFILEFPDQQNREIKFSNVINGHEALNLSCLNLADENLQGEGDKSIAYTLDPIGLWDADPIHDNKLASKRYVDLSEQAPTLITFNGNLDVVSPHLTLHGIYDFGTIYFDTNILFNVKTETSLDGKVWTLRDILFAPGSPNQLINWVLANGAGIWYLRLIVDYLVGEVIQTGVQFKTSGGSI